MALSEKDLDILETIEFVRLYLESFLFKSSQELPSEMPITVLNKLNELSVLIEKDTYNQLEELVPELLDLVSNTELDNLKIPPKKKIH